MKVPGFAEVKASVIAIRFLFHAPNKTTRNADRYKGVLDTKAQPKQNKKDHPDAHFQAATVKFVHHFVGCYSDLCIFLSVDDKSKVNGDGKPAVSRYLQNKKFVSYLSVPSGYLTAQQTNNPSCTWFHCNNLLQLLQENKKRVAFILSYRLEFEVLEKLVLHGAFVELFGT